MVQRCILLMSLFMMGMAHQGLSQGFQVEKANLISNTPRDIIEALCFGPGIEVVDIEFEGVAGAVGSFSGAQAFVGIDSGFVMTTGVVETSGDRIGIDQPVTELANVDNISAANYEGLDALANSEIIEDVAIYRITFVPANDSILFRYVFASEEYPTFVCSPFNDVFGFYLTGPSTADGQETTTNLAVVPGTTLPVSINSVNSGTAGTHFSVSPDVYCDGNNGSLMNAESFVTNQSFPVYNGFTTIFRAEAAVVPCQTYTMELVLADAGDPFFDSALFFEAESFCSFSGEENVSTNIDPDAPILIEGCDQNAVQLDLTAYSDAVFPLTFSIKGDAQLGLDYDSIPTRGVINEPVDQLELLIQTIEDNIQEDPELLQIILSSDECIADTIELYIIDDLQIIGPTVASCDGSPITLSVDQLAINSLNPPDEQDEQNWINTLTFNWSNGMTGRSIQVSPTETTTYFVEYGNELNNCIASITVTVSGAEITINEALCFNEPGIEVNGTIYNLLNPVGTEIIESSGGCDSIVSINLTPVSSDNFSGTYCEDERFEFGGQVFDAQNPQGTVVVPGGGADGCDLLLNVDLSFIANSQGTVNELLCTNEQLVVGGTVFDSTNPTGEIVLEGVAANGCDSIIQVALSFYEASEPGLVTTTLCTGESIEVNGQIYDENNPSGSFILAGADQNGCDSTVQVAISFYPASGSEATFAIEEGETIAPEGEQLIANGQYTYVYTNVNGCDSTVVVNVSVKPNTSTITDSIAIGYPQSSCVNTDLFQNIASATLDCDDGLDLVTYVLDEEICVSYDGLEVGIDETCVVVCDDLGLCDTTRFIISVFTNLLDAVDDFDTTSFDTNIAIDVLANDWISSTVLTDFYLVDLPRFGTASINADQTISFDPNLTACDRTDQFSYAICNEIGCDTATVFLYLADTEGLCDAVWPGDVGNDGLVNQLDFWAVGLGFGQNGPIRPDATIEWTPQPAIDWSSSITFIYEINSKFADCNGDGAVNDGDYEAIDQNWGLTHNLVASGSGLPLSAIPLSAEMEATQDGWVTARLDLGAIQNFYGLYFLLEYDPRFIDDTQLELVLDESWTGHLGSDLLKLEKPFLGSGKAHFALVRTNQIGQDGIGEIGTIRAKLKPGISAAYVQLYVSNMQLLSLDGRVERIQGTNVGMNVTTSTLDHTHLAEAVSIYPNPSKGNFSIQLPELVGPWRIDVLDTSGALFSTKVGDSSLVEWEQGLEAGIYLLRIQTEQGVVTKKICITP